MLLLKGKLVSFDAARHFLLVCSLRSAACGLRSAVCGLRSAVCGLRSAVCGLRSAVCGLRSAVCGLRSAVCVFTRLLENCVTLNCLHAYLLKGLGSSIVISLFLFNEHFYTYSVCIEEMLANAPGPILKRRFPLKSLKRFQID